MKKEKEKRNSPTFVIQIADAEGTRWAEDAAGQQPPAAQPGCVEVTFMQLSQTHVASIQENTASALQQS